MGKKHSTRTCAVREHHTLSCTVGRPRPDDSKHADYLYEQYGLKFATQEGAASPRPRMERQPSARHEVQPPTRTAIKRLSSKSEPAPQSAVSSPTEDHASRWPLSRRSGWAPPTSKQELESAMMVRVVRTSTRLGRVKPYDWEQMSDDKKYTLTKTTKKHFDRWEITLISDPDEPCELETCHPPQVAPSDNDGDDFQVEIMK